ncbi:MAG: sugar ABC transporter ATP-binding protein, partial [Blautia sp.]|nr:sugar ABC transporter ATP-binding protein [Blautia sp.]
MGNTILQMKNITKRYPGVVALNNVSVNFNEAEVHALLGENGAGKSTLIKVLSGAVTNDEGQILIGGQTYEKMTPAVSRQHGVEVIYQEYNLIPSLTVAENICLGSKMHGLSNKKEMIEKTQAIFDQYEINIDPRVYVRELSPAQQQLVEITKAISKDAKIIVMD